MVTTPSFTQYCQVFCHNVSHVILSFLKHHVIVFPRTISRYSVCKSDFWRHLLTKTVLTTTHSYCLPSNFTNAREEFVAGILPQKEIALLLWQDEKKKDERTRSSVGVGENGRREGNEAVSSSFASSRLLNHSHTHTDKSSRLWHHTAWRTIRSW